MDHLFDNPDMSDLSITATDTTWSWGQTSKEFIVSKCNQVQEENISFQGHKLVLCSASPVFHQLFFPQENGLEIPSCLVLTKYVQYTTNNTDLNSIFFNQDLPTESQASWRSRMFHLWLWRVCWSTAIKTGLTAEGLRTDTPGTCSGDSGTWPRCWR